MRRSIVILFSLILLSSCSDYSKLLKSEDYEKKWETAQQFFKEGKYMRCIELLEQTIPRYRFTDDAEEMSWMYANCHYLIEDYYSAIETFNSFYNTFQYGKYAEEAYYKMSVCSFLISPRAELDQKYTNAALSNFTYFVSKYPNSQYIDECNNYIKELQEKLAEKSYLSAKLYYDMGQYKAAITALTNSISSYPDSKHREHLRYMKLDALYKYAQNSVYEKQKERYQDALDEYFTYIEEYPDGSYTKDVQRIYKNSSQFLGITSKTSSEQE